MKEYNVGERFISHGRKVKVKENKDARHKCHKCFYSVHLFDCDAPCMPNERSDGKSVMFVEKKGK